MVEFVPWMSPIHYAIFEFFDSHDIDISAKGLSSNIDYSRDYVLKECKTLVEVGLLEKDRTLFALTDRGRAFLAGELGADDLDRPE